jgi:hypothetical protein
LPDSTTEPKAEILGIVYEGSLSVCSCGSYGVFHRGVPYRLRGDDYTPPMDMPRITLEQARALVSEHSSQSVEFIRDSKGEVIHNKDGTPRVRSTTHGPFRIVCMENEEMKSNG